MKKLFLAVLLLASVYSFGQGATLPFPPLQGPNGASIPFAKLTFCTYPATFDTLGNCTNTVTVFQDIGLNTPYPSGITTDGLGNFPPNQVVTTALWFAPAQNYCFTATGANLLHLVNFCTPFSVSVAPGSSPSFLNITAQSYDNVQTITSSTAGSDICAKISTAIAALPSTGGIVDTRFFQGSQVCASNPFTGLTKGVTVIIGDATIQHSVPLLFDSSNIAVHGQSWQQSKFIYTGGSTAAAVKIGTTTPTVTEVIAITLDNIQFSGNASTTDVVLLSGVIHSTFRNLDLRNATGACFHTQFTVVNDYYHIACTLNHGAFTTQPTNGLLFDQIDSSHQTTASTVALPLIEGVSGTGIKCTGCSTMKIQSGTSEQNNRGIEFTGGGVNNRNTVDTVDMEANTTEDILDNGSDDVFINVLATKLAHIGTAAGSTLKYGWYNSIQVDSGATNAKIQDLFYNASSTGVLTDSAQGTIWENIINAVTNTQTPINGVTGWTSRDVIPQITSAGVGTVNRQDMLRGTWDVPTTGITISTTASGTTPWRFIFIGAWMNNFDGGGLAQPSLITECTTAAPTITVGSLTVTCSKNGSGQVVLTSSGSIATFTGTIQITTMTVGAAGTASAQFKGSVTAPGLPQTIGSGTAAMTTAGILTGACGTTITVAATGVATTDIINVTRNAAATIGNGGGLTLNAWPTSGNVNFNYCNSAAGTITPTAMTVNWSVVR